MKLSQFRRIIKEEIQRALKEDAKVVGEYRNGLYTNGLVFNYPLEVARIKREMGDFIKKTGQIVPADYNPDTKYIDGVTLDVNALYKALETGKVKTIIPKDDWNGSGYGLDIYMPSGFDISFKDIPETLYKEMDKYYEDAHLKVWRVAVQIAPETEWYLFDENEFGQIDKYQIPTTVHNKVKHLEPKPADWRDEKAWIPIKKYIMKAVVPELTKQVRSVFPVMPGLDLKPDTGLGKIYYDLTPVSKNPEPPTEQDKTKLTTLLKGAIDVEFQLVKTHRD